MTDPILQTLTAVGLTDKEAKVFFALLKMEQGTASAIAEQAGIKRSIVYFTLKRLIKQGYAQEIATEKVKCYRAVSPTRLLQNVQANVENLRFMLPFLRALQQSQEDKPRIEFFEGKEAILPLYRAMEFAKRSYYLTCWHKVTQVFPEEVARWSVHAANPKNPNQVKNLIVKDSEGCRIAKKMKGNKKQEFRTLPSGSSFDMNFGIADDTIAITGFSPLFVVVIHSKKVADCAALLFELAWKSAKRLRIDSENI